ncbi:UvrD-helicase domain-containing protein [Gordonia sp. i37]|uniref:UvrD-helicase domain-containing protein n=1 Tax=Gordonia sp. i37 TaxID=1961707 RepID=UPI0009AEBF35|nr:UvrD-helicase domain-containing protein [Gordonia sp. i37]OPX17057.1 helicase [Gordonia sp. i37]
MTENARPQIELDATQDRVAEAAADERLIVIAGAGQGKTEVVTARLQSLIEEEDLSASVELLVLSFSRAAVHAVRSRLSERDMAEVNVRTFDSFASQLLLEADVEPAIGFEARIRQATELLADDDDVADLIESLRHVVVDEVQDLVGDRADFVWALLSNLSDDAGFTVLGDPLQGIYDFVLDESTAPTTSPELLDRISTELGATEVSLSTNYRARGADCIRAAELGPLLRSETKPDEALSVLRGFRDTLPHVDRVEDWSFLGLYAGRSAILCRSNAEVLRISRELVDEGIAHAVRRPAQLFGAAKWIGSALGSLQGPIVARSDVELRLEQILDEADAEDAWYLLKSAEQRGRGIDQIDLDRLRRRLGAGIVPLTLTEGDDDMRIIVSTVHRAKGLEFDNVFITDWSDRPDEDDPWAPIRLEYVALTRARDTIVMVTTPRRHSVVSECRWLPDRLQERMGPKGKSRARALEIGYGDSYAARPVAVDNASVAQVQAALDELTPGVAVEAELDRMRSDAQRPIYALTANGRPIGHTTDEFGEDFSATFKVRPGQWPAALTDMVLVSVETVAGDPNIAVEAGAGAGGFWLVPRVAGLARPLWDVMEKVG